MHRNANKSKNRHRETKVRQCQKIAWYVIFIDPDDEEFKDIMKNVRRKLEIGASRNALQIST